MSFPAPRYLDGKEMVDFETMAFTAPFAVGAMLDTEDPAWLVALWQHTVEREMSCGELLTELHDAGARFVVLTRPSISGVSARACQM
jgi:hypothetical protein